MNSEIEQSVTSTEANNAVVDVLGSVCASGPVTFSGTQVQANAGIGNPVLVRVANTTGTNIRSSRLATPAAYTAVVITAAATGTIIGEDNTWIGGGTNYSDAGTGTIGPLYKITTPVPTSGSGAFTAVSSSIATRNTGSELLIDGTVTITTNGTAATNIAVPIPATPSRAFMCPAAERAATGAALYGTGLPGGGSFVFLIGLAGAYPGGSGYVINFSCRIPLN